MDFDDDGRVYLEDVLSAGEECYEAAAEVVAGPASALAPTLQRVAALLHKNKVGSGEGDQRPWGGGPAPQGPCSVHNNEGTTYHLSISHLLTPPPPCSPASSPGHPL